MLAEISGDTINRFVAKAISGAGGADVGIAGAFALNISADPASILNPTQGGQHSARIADNANLTLTAGADLTIGTTYVGISLDGIGETNDLFRGKKGAFDGAVPRI